MSKTASRSHQGFYGKRVTNFNRFLIAFSDAKGTPKAGEGSQEQEAVEEGEEDEGQGEEGAVGGDPECDPLDIAANVDVEHEEEEEGEEGEGEEEDEEEDNDDEYDPEEDEYLNKFINKVVQLSGKSGSPSGSNRSNGSEFVLMITFFTEASQERETTEVNSWEEAICGG